PDVPVHAELVPGHNQRGLLFEQPPRQIRGIDGQSVSQETDGTRDGRDVREQRAMARDPLAQEAIVPLEDRTRAAEDLLSPARGAGVRREPVREESGGQWTQVLDMS